MAASIWRWPQGLQGSFHLFRCGGSEPSPMLVWPSCVCPLLAGQGPQPSHHLPLAASAQVLHCQPKLEEQVSDLTLPWEPPASTLRLPVLCWETVAEPSLASVGAGCSCLIFHHRDFTALGTMKVDIISQEAEELSCISFRLLEMHVLISMGYRESR